MMAAFRLFFYTLSLIPVLLILCVSTERGTQLSIGLLRDCLMQDFHYERLQGRLNDTLVFKGLSLRTASHTFSAQQVDLTLHLPAFIKGRLKIPLILIQDGRMQAHATPNEPIHSTQLRAQGHWDLKRGGSIDIQDLRGLWQGQAFQGYTGFSLHQHRIYPHNTELFLGQTQFRLIAGSDPLRFEWTLQTQLKKQPLHLKGQMLFLARSDPQWQATITVENPLPLERQGISLEALFLSITQTDPKTPLFQLSGGGSIGKAAFTLKGLGQIAGGLQGHAQLTSESILLYQQAHARIKGILDLHLDYAAKRLSIKGTVHIPEANILLTGYENTLRRSQDIILQSTQGPDPLRWQYSPDLHLTLGNHCHISSPVFEANLHGKLHIHQRADGLFNAYGRIRITEGQYRLQGRQHAIHEGALLFPAGTLIQNPLLAMQLRAKGFSKNDPDKGGIYVQGTLQKPLVQLYAKDAYRQAALLSDLGLGDPEKEQEDNQQKVMAQTAFLLSGHHNPLTHFLESGLGIEEFKLESRSTQKTLGHPMDTAIVLGKPLSTKLYLQYVQTIMEPLSTIRLNYALTPLLSTSLESNTEGFGGDFTFSLEKD